MRKPSSSKPRTPPKGQRVTVSASTTIRGSTASQQAEEFRRDGGGYQGELLGGGAAASSPREVTPHERARLVKLSRANYKRSGVYGQVLDTMVNFALADGATITAEPEATDKALRAVLDDPVNAWHRGLRQKFTTLLIDGELPLTIAIPSRGKGPSGKPTLSGAVVIGRLEPETIRAVEVAQLNVDHVLAVEFEDDNRKKFKLPIARPGVELAAMPDGTAAACLLWKVNPIGRRGVPYLSRSLDKCAMLDSVVDELARKAEYTNRFWLHATYESTGDAKENARIEAQLLEWLRSWTPGEAAATTANVKVNVYAPDLKLPDVRAFVEMLLEYILGSHGIPRMWYAAGGDTNRATAVEQGTPIHRAIDALQAELRASIEDLVRFLLWVLREAGVIPARPADASPNDEEFEVTMADVATRDSLRDVNELQGLTVALDAMHASGIISWGERQAIGRAALKGKSFGDLIRPENAPEEPKDAGLTPPPPGAVPGFPGDAAPEDGNGAEGGTPPAGA